MSSDSRRRRISLIATTTLVAIGGAGALAAPAVAASAASPAASSAPVLRVSTDADLAAALSSAKLVAGTEIEITPGTYTTAVSVAKDNVIVKATAAGVVLTSAVTLSGNGDVLDGVTVTGSSSFGVDVKAGTGNTVENVTASGNGDSGIYVANAASHTNLLHNQSSGNSSAASRKAAGIEVRAEYATVVGNVVHDNQDSGIEFYDVGATVAAGANYALAVDNVVYHNGDHGIDNLSVHDGSLINNTVFDNCASGINVEGGKNVSASSTPHLNPAGGYAIVDNVSFDNAVDTNCAHGPQGTDKKGQAGQIRIADDQPASVSVLSNLTWVDPALAPKVANGSSLYVWSPVANGVPTVSGYTSSAAFFAATGQGEGGVEGDPKLKAADPRNLGTVDLRPTAGSPAVGKARPGNNNYAAVDADWSARTDPSSIGAYEFGGTPGTAPSAPLPDPTNGGGVTPPATTPVYQLGGFDRFATGIIVSKRRWAQGQADAVVLATGSNFADALAGVPLAAKANGPLLLVDGPNPTVRADVLGEIARVLKPGGKIYILGGTGAVDGGVEADLARHGFQTVQRFAGADRYQTSVKIAQDGLGSPAHVVVATGNGFADALASGPYATGPFASGAHAPAAIVLSDDKTLDPSVAGYLAGKDGASIATVGHQAGVAVPRAAKHLEGIDRFATDAAVAGQFTGAQAGTQVGIADGLNFPDALTGGAYMASLASPGPIVLVDGSTHTVPDTANVVLGSRTGTTEGDVFGGTGVITPAMDAAIANALHAAFDPHTPQF